MDEDLAKRVREFLMCFELMFDSDWEYTKDRIADASFIHPNGTFLDPEPGRHYTGGAGDNWGNRSSLLSAYRELRSVLISEGLYASDMFEMLDEDE